MAFNLFRISIISVISFAKKEISFEVSTFGGSSFSGGSGYFRDLPTPDMLSLLSEVRYFLGVVTFGTLR